MASRRMFKLSVVSSDAFTAMTLSAQALYFHLNLRADDDGFIDSPLRIMREIGANQGDMEQLLSKRYVLYYESGVIVIKHWRLHNRLRKDRYKPTLYQEEFAELEAKENGVYTERKHTQIAVSDVGEPNGNQMAHSIGKYRLVKGSVVKDSKVQESKENNEEKTVSKGKSKTTKESKSKYGNYGHVKLTDNEFNKLQQEYPNHLEIIQYLDDYCEMHDKQPFQIL